jgi:hypothetical protein
VTSAPKNKMCNKQTVFSLFGLFDEYYMFASCELAFIFVITVYYIKIESSGCQFC